MKVANRVRNLRRKLAELGIDGIFVSQPENRYYLSGFNGSDGFLLITSYKTILATDFRYLEQAQAQAPDYEIFRIANNMSDWFPRLIDDQNLDRLGFEAGDLTFAFYQQLSDILSKTSSKLKLVPTERLIESLRAIKELEEIELISQAIAISDAAFEHIKDRLHTGISETEAAWEIERFMRENGSQAIPFNIIVASGPNAALPHAQPSPRKIGAGEPVVIDIGAKIGGYCSDLSRTLCLGAPDETFRRLYNTVLEAQLRAIASIKEGMKGNEADSFARQVIEQAGHGEAFGHSLGHGVGLATHELPRLGPNSTDQLTAGMTFTIEPGIYLTGWGGIRIEDLVTMENGKIRVLSKASK